MKNRIPTLEEYALNEQEINSVNEGVVDKDVTNKIIKDLQKNYKELKLGPDTFDEIKNAMIQSVIVPPNDFDGWGLIMSSKAFTKTLEKKLKYGGTFYLDNKGNVYAITRAILGDDIVYINKKWVSWTDEAFLQSLYPQYFDEKYFEIYRTSDDRQMTNDETIEFVKAFTRDEAREKSSIKTWYNYGIREISPNEIKERIKQVKKKIDDATAEYNRIKDFKI